MALDQRWAADCLRAGDTPEQVAAWAGVSVAVIARLAAGPLGELPKEERPRGRPADVNRDASIITSYRRGDTLLEIAEVFGLTRQRIFQITERLIAGGAVERRPKRTEPTERQKTALRRRGPDTSRRSSVWVSRDPLLKAAARAGYSARQVAIELGITRNAVLGRAHRLGVKFFGRMPRDQISDAVKRRWADPNFRARNSAAIRAGWAARQERLRVGVA